MHNIIITNKSIVDLKIYQNIIENLVQEEFNQYYSSLKANNELNVIKNGYMSKVLNCELGKMIIKIPRLRHHNFKPSMLNNISYSNKLIDLAVNLYGNGLSTSRIASTIFDTFNVNISKQHISNFCKKLNDNVENYFDNSYDDNFKIIYLDAKYFSVRDSNSKSKVALMSAIGLDSDQNTSHLHMEVIERESQ